MGNTPHNTLKKLESIDAVPSANHVPTINHPYEISCTLKPKNTHPFKNLIEEQQSDDWKEDSVIQKIQTNQFSYDFVSFNKRIIKNIANVYCTDTKEVKSALYWGLTFDIFTNPHHITYLLWVTKTEHFTKCHFGHKVLW